MSALESHVVLAAAECVIGIGAAGLAPAEAQRRMDALGQRHPDTAFELVWDGDIGDGFGRSYDVLLRLARGGTLSLAYSPDRALPWPLRGARRFGEADLLQVNSTVLTVGEAIVQIETALAQSTVATRLIDACLLREELERNPVELSRADLEHAIDAFRRRHRLYSALSCEQWMARRGLAPVQFEELVAGCARVAQVRRRVTDLLVDPFLETSAHLLDRARIVCVRSGDARSAHELCERFARERIDLLRDVQARFVAGSVGDSAELQPFVIIDRSSPSPLAAAIFDAQAGTLVGPIEEDGSWVVAQVLALERASPGETSRERARNLLFERWLAERRASARVDWFWQTPQ